MDLFLTEHALTHAEAVRKEGGSSEDPFARGLTDQQMRIRPVGLNSVAWNLFHVARTEDVGLNVLIAGRPQVLDEGDWLPELRLTCRHNGSGMDDAEVDELTGRVDLEALLAYRLAVGGRTAEVMAGLDRTTLAQTIDPARIADVHEQAVVHPGLRERIAGIWGSRATGWFLFFGAGHNLWHYGETQTIRSLIARGISN